MKSKCTPVSIQFFEYMLDSARKKGYQIYWGTVGFSIRARLSGSEYLSSIAYGYPPDEFQLYFGHLPFPEEKISKLGQEISELGAFKATPKTLKLFLSSENLQLAKDIYALLERRIQEL